MRPSRVSAGIAVLSTWIARLALVNLLWLMFTLVGLVLLGFFPATAAGYQLLRDRMRTPELWDERMLPEYWRLFRARLLRANAAGYALAAVGGLIAAALAMAWRAEGAAWQIPVTAVCVVAAVAFLGTVVHLPFIVAQLDARPGELVMASWYFAMSHPIETLVVIIAVVGQSYLLGALPAAAVFFLFSPIAALSVALGLRGYALTERRAALQSSPS